MELAVLQGVAHQPRHKTRAHGKGPYDNTRSKARASGGRGEVLGELTNSPKKSPRNRLSAADEFPTFLKSMEGEGTPSRLKTRLEAKTGSLLLEKGK